MDLDFDTLLAGKAWIIAAWLAFFFLAERLRPAAQDLRGPDEAPGGWPRLGRNAGLWLLNSAVAYAVILPLTFWAAEHRLDWRPEIWAGGGGLLVDLLLLDFLIYWWHRANHVVPFLWRFHEVHHLDRFLDSTSAIRFHFGEILLSAGARAGVILLLDIPFSSILVFEVCILLAAIFHHSNLALPAGLERTLARGIITPSIHWVHHHALRRDTDSNYGTVLSIWDPLFGSRSPAPRDLAMPIGVEARPELPLPGLLLKPFRPAPPT